MSSLTGCGFNEFLVETLNAHNSTLQVTFICETSQASPPIPRKQGWGMGWPGPFSPLAPGFLPFPPHPRPQGPAKSNNSHVFNDLTKARANQRMD